MKNCNFLFDFLNIFPARKNERFGDKIVLEQSVLLKMHADTTIEEEEKQAELEHASYSSLAICLFDLENYFR